METQTIEQGVTDARQGLMDSLSKGNDFSGFKPRDESPAQSNADTTLNKPEAASRSESDATDVTQTSSQPEKEGATKTEGVATNPTDSGQTNNQSKQTRAPARIQELLDQNKAKDLELAKREARIAELERNKQEPSKPNEPKALIAKPQFSTEYLQGELSKYKQAEVDAIMSQDKNALLYARNYIDGINKLLRENEAWEQKNGEAIKQHNAHQEYFKQEALKKWPELSDAASEHTKEYTGIRGWIQKEIPALLDSPVSEYLIAQIANWKLSSGRLAATESDLKKAREEIAGLKKGSLPITTDSKKELGSNDSPENSIKDAKKGLLESIRNSNLTMKMG